MTITIRQEHPNDYFETENVVKEAFKHEEMSDGNEHELVRKLRKCEAFIPELSLVAVDEEPNLIVGHIILTKIKIKNQSEEHESLALAPVSVLPNNQRQGLGQRLCQKAIDEATELGYSSVVVLGHPSYYPKLGFEKASSYGIHPPFDVPDEAFMVLELKENTLNQITGIVEYSSPFNE